VSNSSSKNLIEQLIKIFDDLLIEAGWESSFLLKVSKKRLLKARGKLEALREEQSDIETQEDMVYSQPLNENQISVFISLYQAGGHNLSLWEQMMKLLSSCSLGRPIYADENEVRKAIAQRSDLQREAYVEVVVDKNFIMDLPEEKRPKDHLGASLLVLKANAINIASVRVFVHANKIRYRLLNGKLVAL
jgi:Dot/Icm secretion system protein IcmQ